jgi:hypothetical protein
MIGSGNAVTCDNEIEAIAVAWMKHQGYTDDQIAAINPDHRAYGCDPEGYNWNCCDEYGQSLHPVWDAMCEASEMAVVVVEALRLAKEERTFYDHSEPYFTGFERRLVGPWIRVSAT